MLGLQSYMPAYSAPRAGGYVPGVQAYAAPVQPIRAPPRVVVQGNLLGNPVLPSPPEPHWPSGNYRLRGDSLVLTNGLPPDVQAAVDGTPMASSASLMAPAPGSFTYVAPGAVIPSIGSVGSFVPSPVAKETEGPSTQFPSYLAPVIPSQGSMTFVSGTQSVPAPAPVFASNPVLSMPSAITTNDGTAKAPLFASAPALLPPPAADNMSATAVPASQVPQPASAQKPSNEAVTPATSTGEAVASTAAHSSTASRSPGGKKAGDKKAGKAKATKKQKKATSRCACC